MNICTAISPAAFSSTAQSHPNPFSFRYSIWLTSPSELLIDDDYARWKIKNNPRELQSGDPNMKLRAITDFV